MQGMSEARAQHILAALRRDSGVGARSTATARTATQADMMQTDTNAGSHTTDLCVYHLLLPACFTSLLHRMYALHTCRPAW